MTKSVVSTEHFIKQEWPAVFDGHR